MSDLQTRIARVLKDFAPTMPHPEIVWCADAIINELALRKEFQGVPPDRIVFRYVTDWKDDGKA
jgi:hypothetical protein